MDAATTGRPRQRLRTLARGLVLAVGLAFLAGGLYGIASPFIWGHYGYHGGEYSTRARHTLRTGAILPGNQPGWAAPRPESYYLHHPVLTHHLVTLTMAVLGDHEYAVRGAGLLAALACFVLLVLFVDRRWGSWQAVVAALAFLLVPIDVWYANHIDPGFPGIACLLVFFVFYARWTDTGRWRDGVVALAGVALAGGFEWSPYLAAVPVGFHVLWRGLSRRGRWLAYVPLYALAVLLPAAIHFLIVYQTGHWGELRSSYGIRTYWNPHTFYKGVLDYTEAMLGRPFVWALPVWLVTLLVRAVRRRLEVRDLLGVSFLFSLAAYVQLFKGGVLVHAYRFLYGDVVFAVIAVDLAGAAAALLALAGRGRLRPALGFAGGALVTAAGVGAMWGPAWRGLLESRAHGGVPLTKAYDPDLPRIAFAESVRRATKPGDLLLIHPSFRGRMETAYYLDRDMRPVPSLLGLKARARELAAEHAAVLFAPGAITAAERAVVRDLGRDHPYLQVGSFAVLDLGRAGALVHVETLKPPPPQRPLARFFVGPHPRLARREDAQREVSTLVEWGAAPPASHAPEIPLPARGAFTPLAVYHNYQVLRGDRARAAEARARILQDLGVRGPRPLGAGTTVLGFLLAGNRLHTFYEAGAARPARPVLRVEAREVASGRVQRLDHPLTPPPADWHDGFVYQDTHPAALARGRWEVALALDEAPAPAAAPPRRPLPAMASLGGVRPKPGLRGPLPLAAAAPARVLPLPTPRLRLAEPALAAPRPGRAPRDRLPRPGWPPEPSPRPPPPVPMPPAALRGEVAVP